MAICHYPSIVEGDAETGYSVFSRTCRAAPAAAILYRRAALNAEQDLAAHIALLLGAGEPVPAPSSLDHLPRPIEPDIAEVPRLFV